MRRNLTNVVVLMVIGIFLTCSSVQAASYILQDIGFTTAGEVTININENKESLTKVGPFSVTIQDYDQNFTAFCIEPDQPIGIGANLNIEVELVSAGTVAGGLEAAWLLQNYANADAAALQVALWEIIKDDNQAHEYDLTTGDFQLVNANQTIVDNANEYLDDLSQNFSADGLDIKFMASLNPSKQDLMYIGYILDNGGADAHTPEPTTVFLLGSGLFGIAGLRRKFKKI